MASVQRLARARGPHARRRGSHQYAGVLHVPCHRARGPRGHRARVGDLLRTDDCSSGRALLAADARAQVLVRRAVRRRLLQAHCRARRLAATRARGSRDPPDRLRPRRDDTRGGRPRAPPPDRPAPYLCPLPRRRGGDSRSRVPHRQVSSSSLTSILIWLPIAAAILIWVLPLSRYATGSLAVLFSLAEVGFWIEQAARFDFSRSGLQMSERASWFGDLHVSYHVGVYGFSLWLVGLTVVAMAACTGYGFWVGRDRSRAYFGLML